MDNASRIGLALPCVACLAGLAWTACRSAQDEPRYFRFECVGCESADEIARCRDTFDNDGNGYTDCDDPACRQFDVCKLVGLEKTFEACSDGIDNDGNGKTDCQEDKAKDGTLLCVKLKFCCVYGDTKDPNSAVKSPESSDGACTDGLDNDCNGYLDCADFSCGGSKFCEGSDATCNDGVDNDGNGYIDCADFTCSKSSKVTVCAK